MPTNVTFEYENAEKKFHQAGTIHEKLKALQEMLKTVPKHKGTEQLQNSIKQRIAKLKDQQYKQSQKSGTSKFSLKKEGSATICIIGIPNSGKSTLLKKLTKAKVKINSYPFTTREPAQGILDYHGVKLQIIELPSIVENYEQSENGNAFLSLMRLADLILILLDLNKKPDPQIRMIKKELYDNNIKNRTMALGINNPEAPYYKKISAVNDEIWKNLNLIKVFTKMPGKGKEKKPIALKKSSTIRDLAAHIHKDFLKNFTFARIWGASAKFSSQRIGLDHRLQDDDIVELHMK